MLRCLRPKGSIVGITRKDSVRSVRSLAVVHDGLCFRTPTTADAASMHEIVLKGTLDDNSAYAYLAFATHFPDTCLVAEDDKTNKVLGFVMGYMPPASQDTLFVWQIGVDEAARGRGVASNMVLHLASHLQSTKGVNFIEATVTPDNDASRNLFRGLGKKLGTEVEVQEGFFSRDLFPKGHEEEGLFRIGPMSRT